MLPQIVLYGHFKLPLCHVPWGQTPWHTHDKDTLSAGSFRVWRPFAFGFGDISNAPGTSRVTQKGQLPGDVVSFGIREKMERYFRDDIETTAIGGHAMKTTILVDNDAQEGLGCEWGFSALIETDNGTTILLDSGASGLFVQNARDLGIDLNDVDCCVLSHAHFDHADGFGDFFAINSCAPLLIRNSCDEDCYSDAKGDMTYVGIQKGLLEEHAGRIERVDSTVEFAPGAWLLGHSTEGLEKIGEREHLYLKRGDELVGDAFDHEQSLVIETPRGLVVFNSCSHGGIENIIEETRAAFPGKHIIALIGGLHLFMRSDDEVRALANVIRDLGIEKLCTGHCTGDQALAVLEEELGDMVEPTFAGKAIEI